MTSHELARALLGEPDAEVVVVGGNLDIELSAQVDICVWWRLDTPEVPTQCRDLFKTETEARQSAKRFNPTSPPRARPVVGVHVD